MRGFARVALISSATLLLAAAAAPGGAQTTTETKIAYAAESAAAGVTLAITPPGTPTPAGGVFGASTSGDVSSDGPAANGTADALAVVPAASPVGVTTKAPPDDTKNATSPIPAQTIPGVGGIALLQGSAASTSEAEDGSPSTENDGSLEALDVSVAGPMIGPLGTVSGTVAVAKASSFADARAPKETNVSASSGNSGTTITASVNLLVVTSLCASLPAPLQPTCNTIADQVADLLQITVTVAPSDVSCSWDGKKADCDGNANSATVSIPALGINQTVDPNTSATIPDADPFLVRVIAGGFNETVDGDQGSAISAGLSVELLGTQRANPGLVTFALGQSTAGVSGEITETDTIARTGGPLVPVFLGGGALVAAGVGLRRFLKRR